MSHERQGQPVLYFNVVIEDRIHSPLDKLLLLLLFLFALYLVPADKKILASIIIHEAILRLFFPLFIPGHVFK